MKIRITPLFTLSLLRILYPLYWFVSNQHDEEGWGAFGTVILVICGLIGFFVYGIIRFAFNLKLMVQIFVELIVLGALFLTVKFSS